MNILAVGAHPDDLELLCAGTLAKLAKAGHHVFMAHMTTGDKGGKMSAEKLAQIRMAEANDAAEIIGATSLGGFCGDLELYNEKKLRDKVIDTIRKTRPDVIISHSLNDYHPDHRIAGEIVLDAAYASTIASYASPEGLDALPKRAAIWYMDTVAGIDFQPKEFVDITDTVEIKQEMIKCHESQMQWMSSYRHSDMTYLIEWIARWRGHQCGVPYAEAFQTEASWGSVHPEGIFNTCRVDVEEEVD